MPDVYIIPCIEDGITYESQVEIEDNGLCRIVFKYRGQEYVTEDENYFYALKKLRVILERNYIQLLCQGCAVNVYPSPMILDMGDALRAYKLTMGKRAKLDDLVDIFTPCEPKEFATIEEQAGFYDAWVRGPKE